MYQYRQTIAADAHVGFDTIGAKGYRRFKGREGVFRNRGMIASVRQYQHN
jgi:hypothetical protein